MILKRNYLPLLSVSTGLVLVLLVHVDPSLAYSNRLLRFAQKEHKWRIPPNIYDLFKLKRAGLESNVGNSPVDYEDGNQLRK